MAHQASLSENGQRWAKTPTSSLHKATTWLQWKMQAETIY
jgi:hypothetical protein